MEIVYKCIVIEVQDIDVSVNLFTCFRQSRCLSGWKLCVFKKMANIWLLRFDYCLAPSFHLQIFLRIVGIC